MTEEVTTPTVQPKLPRSNPLVSWLHTLVASLIVDFSIGILMGINNLLETGDITQSSLYALLASVATATLRHGMKEAIVYLSSKKDM